MIRSVARRIRKLVSPDTERRSLEYYLRLDPSRSDLRRRLCVLRLQRREHVTEDDIERAFPEYIGAGSMYSILAPLYLPAHEKGEAHHLNLLTRVLHSRFPDCPCCLYFRASWLFHYGSPTCALALLDESRNLVQGHDYLAQLYITLLCYEGRPAGDPRLRAQARIFIAEFFKTHTGDMWRQPNFRLRQNQAVRRGIPPILIVTLPKSGSVFLLNTFSRGLSIPYTYLCPPGLFNDFVIDERVRDFASGGAIAVEHLEATDRNLDDLYRNGISKIIFHYRDVRQSALSYVHHIVSDEITAEPRQAVLGRRDQMLIKSRLFESTYRRLFAEGLTFLEAWAERIANDSRFEFLVTNFDDLAMEGDLIGGILEFHNVPRHAFEWSVIESDKAERAAHFRKGLTDEWRQVLSGKLQAEIEKTLKKRPILSLLDSVSAACRRRYMVHVTSAMTNQWQHKGM